MMKEPIKISILGDICPARKYSPFFANGTVDSIFSTIADYLNEADLVLANLEAPTSQKGVAIKKCGGCLRGYEQDLDILKKAGIHALSLANNHILDYGEEALFDTIDSAQKRGFVVFGAGKNTVAAKKPVYFNVRGWTIGALGFCEEEFNSAYESSSGANLFDPYESFDDIRTAKENCDFLIIFYHGGIENFKYPSPLLQKKCRKMAQAGADLVLCQHSHCIGTLEIYDHCNILYGQGNTLFGKVADDEMWNTGLLVTVVLKEEQQTVSHRLLEANEKGVRFADKVTEVQRLKQLAEESERIKNSAWIEEQWLSFCKKEEATYLPILFCWKRMTKKANRLLKNRLVKSLISRKQRRATMNLIRCDAHREVLETIFESQEYGERRKR